MGDLAGGVARDGNDVVLHKFLVPHRDVHYVIQEVALTGLAQKRLPLERRLAPQMPRGRYPLNGG